MQVEPFPLLLMVGLEKTQVFFFKEIQTFIQVFSGFSQGKSMFCK